MEGILKLKENSKQLEYGLFNKGEYLDLHKILNSSLGDTVHIKIKSNKGEIIFDEIGLLLYKSIEKHYYNLFIGEINLEDILLDLIDSKITISIKTIDKGDFAEDERTES